MTWTKPLATVALLGALTSTILLGAKYATPSRGTGPVAPTALTATPNPTPAPARSTDPADNYHANMARYANFLDGIQHNINKGLVNQHELSGRGDFQRTIGNVSLVGEAIRTGFLAYEDNRGRRDYDERDLEDTTENVAFGVVNRTFGKENLSRKDEVSWSIGELRDLEYQVTTEIGEVVEAKKALNLDPSNVTLKTELSNHMLDVEKLMTTGPTLPTYLPVEDGRDFGKGYRSGRGLIGRGGGFTR